MKNIFFLKGKTFLCKQSQSMKSWDYVLQPICMWTVVEVVGSYLSLSMCVWEYRPNGAHCALGDYFEEALRLNAFGNFQYIYFPKLIKKIYKSKVWKTMTIKYDISTNKNYIKLNDNLESNETDIISYGVMIIYILHAIITERDLSNSCKLFMFFKF